ncbi:UNVERIFIED_CONTAM: hypothetical protein HDU68_012233, partial [Siphonaria sp. JEL0065]
VVFADVLTQPGGRSKGCGVVEYSTPEEAEAAIRELNDTPLLGRQVFVREDREPDIKFSGTRSGGGDRGGYGGPRGGSGPNPSAVYITNLPYIVAWQDLKDLFRQAGNVTRADIHNGPDGRSKGTGIVGFDSPTDAQNAIFRITALFNGYEWHGRKLEVREDLGNIHGGGDRGDRGDYGGGRGGYNGGYGGPRGGGGGSGGDRGCFKCGKPGHRARECREGGGGGYNDYPPPRRDYYDQGPRGGYGGGYDRGYGGRPSPYGAPYDNRGGYNDYYSGRGGYGGPAHQGGYRDYPPQSRGGPYGGDYNRGPPPPLNGGYNEYPLQQGGGTGRNDYPPPGQQNHQSGPNIYGDFR